MALEIRVTTDFDRFAATLTEIERNQLPYAAMLALNACAREVKAAEQAEMRQVFDRPTPFTLNSLFVSAASKRNLEAAVFFKDFAPKGTPAGKYLRPQIEGGDRRMKAMERKLGGFVAPAKAAELDGYGNLNRGQIVTILSRVNPGAMGLGRGNSGRGKRKAEGYFAIRPGMNRGGLPPAIYRVTGKGASRQVIPVLVFTKGAPGYRKRFDFFGVAERTMRTRLPALLGPALQRAMSTRR